MKGFFKKEDKKHEYVFKKIPVDLGSTSNRITSKETQ